jgi:hypothetical protein
MRKRYVRRLMFAACSLIVLATLMLLVPPSCEYVTVPAGPHGLSLHLRFSEGWVVDERHTTQLPANVQTIILKPRAPNPIQAWINANLRHVSADQFSCIFITFTLIGAADDFTPVVQSPLGNSLTASQPVYSECELGSAEIRDYSNAPAPRTIEQRLVKVVVPSKIEPPPCYLSIVSIATPDRKDFVRRSVTDILARSRWEHDRPAY